MPAVTSQLHAGTLGTVCYVSAQKTDDGSGPTRTEPGRKLQGREEDEEAAKPTDLMIGSFCMDLPQAKVHSFS